MNPEDSKKMLEKLDKIIELLAKLTGDDDCECGGECSCEEGCGCETKE